MSDWIDRARLIVITRGSLERGIGHEEIARAALSGGCRAVQIRDKVISDREMITIARNLKPEFKEKGALLFINDRVDVAYAVGADGIHLGVNDIEVKDARGMLGPVAIIGYSPEDLQDAEQAVMDGVDYLGVGPVYGTYTKHDAGDAIGVEGVIKYVKHFEVPIIAVGSIGFHNAKEVIEAGAAGVAVCSAVCDAPDLVEATKNIVESVRSHFFRKAKEGAPREAHNIFWRDES